jgi:hypothetical protein
MSTSAMRARDPSHRKLYSFGIRLMTCLQETG